MMGLRVSYYCPVCKNKHNSVLGVTPYRMVNGEDLANIRCCKCHTELLVKASEPFNVFGESKNTRHNMQVRDYTKDKFSDLVDKLLDSGCYSDKDSEEFIMNDVISKLENQTSEAGVSRHLLSIKKYIELKLCTKFNNPTHKYVSYVVDNGDDKLPKVDANCVIKKEDTEFVYSVCY